MINSEINLTLKSKRFGQNFKINKSLTLKVNFDNKIKKKKI